MSITSFLARLLRGGAGPAKSGKWDLPEELEKRMEAARWGYRLILLREPENEEVVRHLAQKAVSTRILRDILMRSQEARTQAGFPMSLQSMSGNEPAQAIQVQVTPEQQRELFDRVQSVWKRLGETKPHWSVLTGDEFLPDKIGKTVDEFYRSGVSNITTLMRTLARNGIDAAKLRICMDFGCGLGRLTAALSPHFERVIGVDISSSHLAIAREEIAKRGLANVSFEQLEAIDAVERLPQVDLVFSVIVLQHNPPPVIRALFAALLGRVAPGGAAVIQIPTYLPGDYSFDVERYLREGGKDMEMHAIPQHEAFALVRAAGMEVLEVIDDAWTGMGRSNTFVVRRPVIPA